ncbi:MAG: hypothetical protein JWQ69_5233 [Pseudomonas sp.]|nr:hypothetical protein [Pseudomonas sp.]
MVSAYPNMLGVKIRQSGWVFFKGNSVTPLGWAESEAESLRRQSAY